MCMNLDQLKQATEIMAFTVDLIKELELGDGYGETGGLFAIYDVVEDTVIIEDEAYKETIQLTSNTQRAKDAIEKYLREFADAKEN